MIARLWQSLRFRLSGLIGPRMVYGYRRHDGVYLPRTRVSNMTRIEYPQRLELGDNIWIGHFNLIDASGGLSIGEGCQITNYVSLLTHSSHIALRLYGNAYLGQRDPKGYLRSPSSIGPYTFIGPHSVLMPGVHLGKGALVSAYSFVTAGEYPDFAVLVGNPAQVIGDTREGDARWLQKHPELAPHYAAWAGRENLPQ
ncbi:acyltransferase [Gulbenkiania mobilis]|uniref:Acetyltransferase-like isoleucine patch superfamily enzyme n=1 Tax=Gulbenkiania mobilis TaxID=397457 RepID=A0ABY2CTX6_GULMO|nr:acetyltransferase-like isoleucine patch superfamily enzyme [Gulbenkiania mobilis]